ncbi:MucBP domain-containing protein [Enterococcus gallinarum]|uniref:MucBP domain-containing protein n=2 Tax=Enterococcus gallinarum TaxID=1353 RepID=UPI001C3D38C7|nr:MucBP domain-containing protein [Enterococcus gallinarum]
MGKCSRILLLGGLLLNQAPWTMVVSADSVTEDTVAIQDTVESTIAVEQEETLMSRDSKDERIHSTKDNDGRKTEPSELSQSDSSEPVELNELTSSSSENEVRSQNEMDAIENQTTEDPTENMASGTYGTSDWYITYDGVLHIGSGTFRSTSEINPWSRYRVKKIVFEGNVIAGEDSSYLFGNSGSTWADLTEIEGLDKLDTSRVTNMSGMFNNTRGLTKLDVSNFDTSNVTNMYAMFNGLFDLTSLDVSNFDTRNVTNMSLMFANVINIDKFDLSNFDTRNVTDMSLMFANLRRSDLDTFSMDLSNFNTSQVTNMDRMFQGLNRVSSLDISSFDTSKVTNMSSMFSGMQSLKTIRLGQSFSFHTNAMLPSPISSEIYTGKWVNVGTGSIDFPNGLNIWSASELMANYNGETDSDTYVWQPNLIDAAPVTVKYQNSEGEQLSEPTVLSGKVGMAYESNPKEITGWNVVKIPDNAVGVFTEEAQEVVYVYERSDAAPVTVRYKDTDGNELSDPTILNGKVGLPYTSEAKEISGWYVVETPANASGIFSEEAQEVVYIYERSDAAPVTVKYQDSEGNQLAEPTVLSGKVGLPYASEAKEIPGWYVVETPDNASGLFGEEAQEVVYVYDRSDAAPVTVRYEDTDGNELSDPTILNGKVGLPYASEAKEIPGWYVVETPDNAYGIFSEEAQEVVYVYERSDAAPVTVRYQDSEGNQLTEPTVLSGKVGLPYASEAKEIPGWYVVETPDNASGIFSEEAQEVVYVYERSDAAPVTVKYQDSEGNQLTEPTILSGKVGLPYASESKEIPGWYVVETPANAYGIFSEEAQEVVYIYERSDAAPVTVKYQDSEGNQLSEPTVLSGKVGLPYTSESKEIPGWYVVETPDNASGIFSEEAQEVVYVYERSEAAPVTVRYQDSERNQLAEPTVLSGKVGLPYASEAKEISGWYVVETPDNASGIFSEAAQEVVYIYERSDAAPVTVKYQDSEGNQLAEPTVLSGKVGLPYTSEAKEIPGWYVVETPDNASGIFSEEAQEVVYVYSVLHKNNEKENDSRGTLPATGEETLGQSMLVILGTLLILLSYRISKRKKNLSN